jgi:hypothetical protein
MKTKTCFLAGILVMALLACAYALLETLESNATVTVPVTGVNKTTSTTSTTVKAEKTTTTKPAVKASDKTYKTCKAYCKGIGYDGGDCRMNGLECRVRMEVKSVYGSRLCPTRKDHTCCCKTGDSVDIDPKYSFGIRVTNETVSQNSGSGDSGTGDVKTVRKVSKPSEETEYEYTDDYGYVEGYEEYDGVNVIE